MPLLDDMRVSTESLRMSGRRAIERAKAAGVPAYYRGDDGGLIKELPDGTLQSVGKENGEDVALVTTPRP